MSKKAENQQEEQTPPHGGRWLRDPVTGELTPIQDQPEPAAPAEEEKE